MPPGEQAIKSYPINLTQLREAFRWQRMAQHFAVLVMRARQGEEAQAVV